MIMHLFNEDIVKVWNCRSWSQSGLEFLVLRFGSCLHHWMKTWDHRNNSRVECGDLTLVDVFTLTAVHQFQQPFLHVDETLPCWVTLYFQVY